MLSKNTGSIEKAINGEYVFSIVPTIKEAWAKTCGAKGAVLLAIFFYLIALLGLTLFFSGLSLLVSDPTPDPENIAVIPIVLEILQNVLLMPIGTGIILLGMKRSVDVPINAFSVFEYFPKLLTLLVTTVLMYIMIIIGTLLLVLPGIYLMIAYYYAIPLVVEKGLSPWQALETSRKAITKRWFSVFGFALLNSLIVMVSIIPLGVGVIWSIPMTVIAFGILYRNMFGVEPETKDG